MQEELRLQARKHFNRPKEPPPKLTKLSLPDRTLGPHWALSPAAECFQGLCHPALPALSRKRFPKAGKKGKGAGERPQRGLREASERP